MNQKGFTNIILVVIIVILIGAVGYFAFIKKPEPVAQQTIPTPTQTITPTKTPASPTPTPKDETANWKTYTDIKHGYSIRYPSDWTFEKQSNGDGGLFKDGNGKSTIYNALYLRNLDDGYQDTLEKAVRSQAGGEYMGVQKTENLVFKKIVDDNKTLGYFSQWKIFGVDKIFFETRADFESKLSNPSTSATGKYKTVISFVAQQNFTDTKLFELLVSTFKLTQ
jgi:hypothetical protein